MSVLAVRTGRITGRRRTRAAVVIGMMIAALVIIFGIGLTVGDLPISFTDVLASLTGSGSARADLVVLELRLPRLVTGAAVGAALGAAGAMFQSLTRNPLGSPDIVGFTAGSATGAILAIVVFGGGAAVVVGGALVGGLVCALIVLALASAGGTTTGYRFILIGIGAAAVLSALNGFLVTRAALGDATAARTWVVGSLNARGWETALPLLGVLAILIPVAVLSQRTLSTLELGDDLARSVGVGVSRARFALVCCGLALAAAGTAAAGPVAFIALASPQLARRLTRGSGPGVGAATVMGALLLVTSDIIAQRALAPVTLPVGVVTGLIGGVYLGWLLWTGRSQSRPHGLTLHDRPAFARFVPRS